jgi:hypothetical protein
MQQQQDVLYFSYNCAPSVALLDRLRAREDLLARLRAVDCTQLETVNGSRFFAVAPDGARQELPMMVTNLPALDLAVAPGGKYRSPIVGATKIGTHLGLNSMLAPPRPEAAAAAAAATDSAAPAAIRGTPSDTGGAASFVPAAAAASLARP